MRLNKSLLKSFPFYPSKPLTFGIAGFTILAMKESRRKPNTSIRIDPEAVHQARLAALTQRKTLGQWLEEAIEEKIEREKEK